MKLVKSITCEWFTSYYIAKVELASGAKALFMETMFSFMDESDPSIAAQEKVMNEIMEWLK